MTLPYILAAGAAAGAIALVLFLRGRKKNEADATNLKIASNWTIGPIINGKNYSLRMPLHPRQTLDGLEIDLSTGGEPHYVTFRHGSLASKSKIVMRYRVELADNVHLVAASNAAAPSIITLYFQVKNDDWRQDGGRWWATFASQTPIIAGEHEIVAPLDGAWTSVLTMTAKDHPGRFEQSKIDADRVGFTLGGGDGFGHGILATGQAKIIITGFDVL